MRFSRIGQHPITSSDPFSSFGDCRAPSHDRTLPGMQHERSAVAQPAQDISFLLELTNFFPAARYVNDRDNSVNGLPFGQFFVPSPIVPRNISGMDCLAQFFLRERPDYFAALGNVNRVFHMLCT